jgi:sialate O-acetylesterase
MINNWRQAWGSEFPFLFVQIAPHERMTPEIREAQLLCAKKVPRTACIVTADVGDAKDIHPKAKEPVGARLALAARAIAYGEKIAWSGPVYESMKVEGNRVVLTFSHAEGVLVALDGLKGFTIAGADGQFVNAEASIEGNTVIVSSPVVAQPKAVRYGWAMVPEATLFNGTKLPASPFRTDVP